MQSYVIFATLTILTSSAFAQTVNDPLTLSLSEAVRLAIASYPDVGKARAGADALKGKTAKYAPRRCPRRT